MRIAAAGSVPAAVSAPGRWAASAVPFLAAGAIAVAVATRVTAPSIGLTVGVVGGFAVAVWMFCSERMERPLVVFLLYLGLLDGYLKLKTASSAVTIGRDALLYAILLGWLVRAALRRQSLRLPPLSGWVLAFTAVVLVQMANPSSQGLLHTVGALRPHLEFVPLFFVGYYMLQTRERMRAFFLILLIIASANGVVSMVQLNLTPAQLASWGPGYAFRIKGGGTGLNHVSGRVFKGSTGAVLTRPFGLGDDSGIGEAWGMLALGGALALASLGLKRNVGRISLLLCVGPPLAIISGQGRALLIGSVVALLTYVGLATTVRRLIPTLTAVILGLAAIIAVFAFVTANSGGGFLTRYATITPSKLAATTGAARGTSISAVGGLIIHHPLGNGLGLVGPASGFGGSGASGSSLGSNGETEPGFLVSELGIPGLLVILGFNLQLMYLGVTRIRRLDPETRSLVAALLAGIFAMVVIGVSTTTTATSPFSPYLWFVGGAISYWLTTGVKLGRSIAQRSPAESGEPPAAPEPATV